MKPAVRAILLRTQIGIACDPEIILQTAAQKMLP